LYASLCSFLRLVQSTLQYTSLLEVMGCTIIVCLLGHDVITVRLNNYAVITVRTHNFKHRRYFITIETCYSVRARARLYVWRVCVCVCVPMCVCEINKYNYWSCRNGKIKMLYLCAPILFCSHQLDSIFISFVSSVNNFP